MLGFFLFILAGPRVFILGFENATFERLISLFSEFLIE